MYSNINIYIYIRVGLNSITQRHPQVKYHNEQSHEVAGGASQIHLFDALDRKFEVAEPNTFIATPTKHQKLSTTEIDK